MLQPQLLARSQLVLALHPNLPKAGRGRLFSRLESTFALFVCFLLFSLSPLAIIILCVTRLHGPRTMVHPKHVLNKTCCPNTSSFTTHVSFLWRPVLDVFVDGLHLSPDGSNHFGHLYVGDAATIGCGHSLLGKPPLLDILISPLRGLEISRGLVVHGDPKERDAGQGL